MMVIYINCYAMQNTEQLKGFILEQFITCTSTFSGAFYLKLSWRFYLPYVHVMIAFVLSLLHFLFLIGIFCSIFKNLSRYLFFVHITS